MGLDFSRCNATWACSPFNKFRDRLETQAAQTPCTGGTPDPLDTLLDHSDCDGFIEAWDCGPLATRLLELTDSWGGEDHDRRNTLSLVRGLRLAESRGERIELK